MRNRLVNSIFARLLWSVIALVLSTILLVSAVAIYVTPIGADSNVIAAFAALAVLTLIPFIGVAWLFAGYVTRPLAELTRATRAIAGGQLDAPLTIRRSDELGALANDFRAMQQELVASRQALEAEKIRYAELNDLKERLLANMPHEIKTPLAAIAASLELLGDESNPMLGCQRKQVFDSLHRSVLRLEYLVDNMLDAASIQAGKFRIRREPVTFGAILQEAVTFLQPLLDQREQILSIRDTAGSTLVEADPGRILQVLINLLSNANKYGDARSVIALETWTDPGRLIVQVHNCGEPIPAEVQKHLFERFAEQPRANGFNGTGLGLAIARTIIEMHQGEIGFYKNVERGATFWFSLPRVSEATQ